MNSSGLPSAGGFPWGTNRPTRMQRFIASASIGTIAAVLHFFRAIENGGRSDFAPLWHAARLMLRGQNPYELIGPGNVVESAWPMFYPATAFVVSIPFTIIPSFHWASTAFVLVSAMLLVYGSTTDGWHRLPMFPSIAFLTTATLGQWSILMTAAIYLPFLAFLTVAKPQAGLPVVASSRNAASIWWAAAGGVILIALSFIFLPRWLVDWTSLLGTTDNFIPAVKRFAGPAILIVLLRWRRPETWLVLVAACMPQTWPPYNGLILMSVARTYREMCILSLTSSIGWIGFAWWADGLSDAQLRTMMAGVLNLTGYLPAVMLIMTRPNEGPSPVWLSWVLARIRLQSAAAR